MSLALSHGFTFSVKEMAIARRSTRSVPWQLSYDRDVGPDDLVLLSSLTLASPDPKAPLARIGNAHHSLARAVAQGKPDVEISAIYGYATARLRTLKADPAFQELVLHYEEQEESKNASVDAQILNIGLRASQVLMERLEDEPDSFSNKDLKDLAAAMLDRSGHGPSSNHNVNINDPSRALEAMARSLEAEQKGRILSRSDVIEADFKEVPNDQTTSRSGTPEGGVHGEGTVGE